MDKILVRITNDDGLDKEDCFLRIIPAQMELLTWLKEEEYLPPEVEVHIVNTDDIIDFTPVY